MRHWINDRNIDLLLIYIWFTDPHSFFFNNKNWFRYVAMYNYWNYIFERFDLIVDH